MSRALSEFYIHLASSGGLLQYPENTLANFYNELNHPISLGNRIYSVALVELILNNGSGKIHVVSDSPAFIYTNIIEPQIIGSVSTRLLRIVPFRKSWITFGDDAHYLKICLNELQRIHIYIKDVKGHIYPFDDGHLLVKLHFKETPELG